MAELMAAEAKTVKKLRHSEPSIIDLLRSFGAVPLALAAYNAGSARVHDCGCVPAIPETQAYVANILGLLNGAGDPGGAGAGALEVRLVR